MNTVPNNPAAPPSTHQAVISTVLHHIDVDGDTCTQANIPVHAADLTRYLQELLADIYDDEGNRSFELASPTTQFGNALAEFFGVRALTDLSSPLSKKASFKADELARRLLRIELDAEERYGHLASDGKSLLKKGSFLQILFTDGLDLNYIGVKVEHQMFLDETDFKRHIGIGESNKIYKACKVKFNSAGTVSSINVFDTNTRISTYWWKDFWELVETKTDAQNTREAVKAVIRALNPLKEKAPADYTLLRNATVAAFRQKGAMDFGNFVNKTFASYAVQEDIKDKYEKIVAKIRLLPAQKGFDTKFDLDPASVPFRRIKLSLSDEVSVSYDEDMANISEKIWSSKTKQGKTVVIFEADPEAAEKFVFKAME